MELYGINLAEFSRECQHGVAASTTINNLPSAKSAQLQIQGNQVLFVGKILTGEFLYLIALYNLVPISLICLKDFVGSHVSSEDWNCGGFHSKITVKLVITLGLTRACMYADDTSYLSSYRDIETLQ